MTMYDLRYLRDNLDVLSVKLGLRGADIAWDDLRKLIEDRRNLTIEIDQNRHEIKKVSDEIGRLKRESKDENAEKLHKAQEIRSLLPEIGNQEEKLRTIEQKVTDLALRIPNLPHASVPVGKDSSDNKEERRWGKPQQFSFTPRTHWDLGEALGILDFDRAAKIAGARFAVLMGAGKGVVRWTS